MYARNLVFGVALAMFVSGAAFAQSSFTNTNTMNSNQSFGNFGFNSFFSFNNSNGTSFTQSFNEDGSLCQNFSMSFGGTTITQLINGNTVSDSNAEPGSEEDPCS